MTKLEDIYYFKVTKVRNPELFNFVDEVVKASQVDESNKVEIERRLSLLNHSKDNEHLRQVSDFLAELATFHDLSKLDAKPHWLPEQMGKKMPDLAISNYPIEVKHLNTPREEYETLANGGFLSGNVNKDYELGINKKISDFIVDARKKFISFNEQNNGIATPKGMLYLYFSKSIDAGLLDGIEWETNMSDRVQAIADSQLTKDDQIALKVSDIDHILK